APASAKAMQAREVAVPPTLLAEWWGLGPYGKTWDGVDVMGHSGTNSGGSSYLLWARERNVAVATIVNLAGQGYPFAARVFAELFPRLAGIRPTPKPESRPDVEFDAARFVGTYSMTGAEFTITGDHKGLQLSAKTEVTAGQESKPSPLLPLTP